jgi:hypothetical protein
VAVIHLGIDLGSTGLRAAYAARGDATRTVTLSGPDWPWLLCEPTTGAVPVAFPSVKSRLGTPGGDSGADPADVVTRAMSVVRAKVLQAPGASIGNTAIAVPARFFTAARTTLLMAADAAGLTEVSLISDTVATVVQQTAGARTGTHLVYGMGYSGSEFGLVRAVRGTYRVLGYEADATSDGATLDALVLGSWLTALRRHGVVPDERHRGLDWASLRQLAERVKLRLAAGQSVSFLRAVPVPGGELRVQFEQSAFNERVRTIVSGTLDRVTTLLAHAELDRSAVDLVTLVGGSTAMPALREVVGGLGRPVVRADDDHIARGALRHAYDLARRPIPSYEEPAPAAESQRTGSVPPVSALAATVLTAPGRATGSEPTADGTRQLISTARQQSGGTATVTDLIATARRLFDTGNHANAIATAHLAWRTDPHDVEVFEEMLDLHCAAAMADPTIASFRTDEHWLRCALHHDQTNAHIRGLLAERNYLQGRDLLRAGDRDAARQALRMTLQWAPDHPQATGLLHELGQRPGT